MLNIYYTVKKGLQSIDDNMGTQETTGNKSVLVYTVEHGEVQKFFDLDLLNEECTEDYINDWLEDNGYGEKDTKLIEL